MKKRVIALLLAMLMVVSMLPVTSFAEEDVEILTDGIIEPEEYIPVEVPVEQFPEPEVILNNEPEETPVGENEGYVDGAPTDNGFDESEEVLLVPVPEDKGSAGESDVVPEINETVFYTLTIAESEVGTVKAERETYAAGDTVVLDVCPADGYVVSFVTVNDVPLEADEEGVYSFVMPAMNVTVTAEFVEEVSEDGNIDGFLLTAAGGNIDGFLLTAAGVEDGTDPDVSWDTLTLTRADGSALVKDTDYTVTVDKQNKGINFSTSTTIFGYSNIYNILTTDTVYISGGSSATVKDSIVKCKVKCATGSVANIVLNNVTCLEYLEAENGKSLNVTLEGTNNVDCIRVNGFDTSVKIGGDGFLTGKQIGSDINNDCGKITINSGTISLDNSASTQAAAIGSDTNHKANTITINGGTINAKASYGAAIGSGSSGEATVVNITGGKVTAEASYGAAIGSGKSGKATSIAITGGEVKATAGHGAAIGSGHEGTLAKVEISGGKIDASANPGEAIGQGTNEAPAGTVAISGGEFSELPKNDYLTDDAEIVVKGETYVKAEEGETPQKKTETPASTAVAKIGDVEYETVAAALANVQSGETIIIVKDTTETISQFGGFNVTVEALDGVKAVFNRTAAYGSWLTSDGANTVTLKNITWNVGSAQYQYFRGAKLINCTVTGQFCFDGGSSAVGTTFIQSDGDWYNVWAYGGCSFKDCTFINTVKGKFINVFTDNYNEFTVAVDGCTFINEGSSSKAALNVKEGRSGKLLKPTVNISGTNVVAGNFPTASDSDSLTVINPLVQVDDKLPDAHTEGGSETKVNVTETAKLTTLPLETYTLNKDNKAALDAAIENVKTAAAEDESTDLAKTDPVTGQKNTNLYSTPAAKPVAKVGEVGYANFADALDAWAAGTILTLLDNVTSTAVKVISSGSYTLDLGDYTWTAKDCDAIKLNSSGGLTIEADTNGGITATNDTYDCIYTDGSGLLNLKGGIYNGDVYVSNKTTLITSGVKTREIIRSVHDKKVYIDEARHIVYNGQYYEYCSTAPQTWEAKVNATSVYTRTDDYMGGGPTWQSLNNYDYYDNKPAIVVYFTEADDALSLYTDTEGDAQTAGTKKYYADNNKTFLADNCTITLNKNATATVGLTLNGGHTVTVDASASGASYTGAVVLNDASAKFVEKYGSNTEYADAKVTKGDNIGADKVVKIDKTTANQKTFSIDDYYACQVMQEVQGYTAVNGTEKDQAYSDGKLFINTRTGQFKMNVAGGDRDLTVFYKSDGTDSAQYPPAESIIPEYINAKGNEKYYFAYKGRIAPLENNYITGASIYNTIKNRSFTQPVFYTEGEPAQSPVNYQSFNAAYAVAKNTAKPIILLDNLAPTVALGAGDSFTVKPNGFTFTDTGVTASEGYKVVKTVNADGTVTYSTEEVAYVAQIDNTKYETLADAIAAANSSNENPVQVYLLCDYTFSGDPIEINNVNGKNINFHLGGHDLTVNAPIFTVNSRLMYYGTEGTQFDPAPTYKTILNAEHLFVIGTGSVDINEKSVFTSKSVEEYVNLHKNYLADQDDGTFVMTSLNDEKAKAAGYIVRTNSAETDYYKTLKELETENCKQFFLLVDVTEDYSINQQLTINAQDSTYTGNVTVPSTKWITCDDGTINLTSVECNFINIANAKTTVSGGKVKSIDVWHDAYDSCTGTLTITGGLFGDNPTKYVPEEGYEVIELKDGDEGYADGYRYKVQEKQVKDWEVIADQKLVNIYTANGLFAFAESTVADKAKKYSGYEIHIKDDIDITGKNWKSISMWNAENGFTFDGEDHTITGLGVPEALTDRDNPHNYGAGLFTDARGELNPVIIKNITFDSATVGVENGSKVAIIVGHAYNDITIENVTISNSKLVSTTKMGAFIGLHEGNNKGLANFKNCKLVNTTVEGEYSFALMIGLEQNSDGIQFTNCSADENSTTILAKEFPTFPGCEHVTIEGYVYAIDGGKLWLLDPNGAWAEGRVAGQKCTYYGTEYTVYGGKFYYADKVVTIPEVYPELTPVAQIGDDKYETLAAALEAATSGQTITLLEDCKGVALRINKSVTIDFAKHTYTVTVPAAGSVGTQNQAFQILANNDVTLKNGTIAVSEENMTKALSEKPITRVIQNYANLTLEGMTITDTNVQLRTAGEHTEDPTLTTEDTLIELDNGTVLIKDTAIYVNGNGRFAIAVDDWQGAYDDGAHVTIGIGNIIDGEIRFYSEGTNKRTGADLKSTLTFSDVSFTGKVADAADAVTGGKITVPDGYEMKAIEGEEGKYQIAVVDNSIAQVGTTKYLELDKALDAAKSGNIKDVHILRDMTEADGTAFTLPYEVVLYAGSYKVAEIVAPAEDAAGNTYQIVKASIKEGDNEDLSVVYSVKQIPPHTHVWEYTPNEDGTTHTAHCTVEGCSAPEGATTNHTYKDGKCTACGAAQSAEKPYTVNYYVNGNAEPTETFECAYNEVLTLTAEPTLSETVGDLNVTKNFSHWASGSPEGAKLSTSMTYSFLVKQNVDVYAVYTTNSVTPAGQPVINMTSTYTSNSGTTANYLHFTASRSVPSGYDVVENGIKYATNKLLGYTADNTKNLMLDSNYDVVELLKTGAKVKTSKSGSVANNGDYTMKYGIATNINAYVYALPYVTVKDGSGSVKTVYADKAVAVTYEALTAPTVELTKVYTSSSGSSNYLHFTASRSVASNYQVVENGIRYATNKLLGYSKDLTTNLMTNPDYDVQQIMSTNSTGKVKTSKSGSTANNGDYTLKYGVGANVTAYVYAIPYVTVKDVNGALKTFYGEVNAVTVNSLK